MSIVALPVWYPVTWQQLLNRVWLALFNRPHGPVIDPRSREVIVDVAQLSFTLEDPDAPDEFEDYLSQPISESAIPRSLSVWQPGELRDGARRPPSSGTPGSSSDAAQTDRAAQEETVLTTPRQIVEDAVLEKVAEIERKFGGQVSVRAEVRPGSLVVALSVVTSVWTFVAQYHDLIESIQMLKQHVRTVYKAITTPYQERTERAPRTKSEVVVNDIGTATHAANVAAAQVAHLPAGTLTNTLTPSLTGGSATVHVAHPAARGSLLGCLTLLALVAILVAVVLAGYCEFTGETAVCVTALQVVIGWAQGIFLSLARFFSDAAQWLGPLAAYDV